ncbi:torsin-1B-like isoform X2 [Schistocerca serialis cubense]|uniref:torsin-1B-like isoform X2 n=1 Tax=Schistocerca serialis cubense TaxID=2023355 RepID=UPI00214F3419|nr:torsin-1B-like isoform X2 [Schistocerca serialis cubense]
MINMPVVNRSPDGYFDLLTNAVSGVWCQAFECCDSTWENADVSRLDYELAEKLYGQHIAHDLIVNAIRSHVKGNNHKPLVMSFHGWPGGGKNYVTKFIMKNLFKNGETDKHVHIFSGKAHFPLIEEVYLYQHQLKTWIRGNVSRCSTSMFVFDEVDKMPPGVFDSMKPYLDHHGWFDHVDFRNAIFIFLSNTGSNVITRTMIELYKNGRKRNDLKLSDFENLIASGAFNEKVTRAVVMLVMTEIKKRVKGNLTVLFNQIVRVSLTCRSSFPGLQRRLSSSLPCTGGLHGSDTIAGNVIDHYVPFLPLEEEHVKKCVRDAFESKTSQLPSNSDLEEVLEYLTYGPEEMKIFSNSGCKRVSQKVATVVEKKRYPPRRTEL